MADLLRPGGVLYLVKVHPMVGAVADDGRTIVQDVFGVRYRRWEERDGTYAAPGAQLRHTASYERQHGLGEVLSAVLEAGLVIELFHEHAATNAPWPWAERGSDGLFRLPPEFPSYPLAYSLRARKPAAGGGAP